MPSKNVHVLTTHPVCQGFLFYLPRLLWLQFEEGKLSSLSEGVRLGGAAKEDKDKKDKEEEEEEEKDTVGSAAANVAAYVNLDEAGHTVYGMAYLVAQVRRSFSKVLFFNIFRLLPSKLIFFNIFIIKKLLSPFEKDDVC